MNQEKIGRLIAQCRKEMGITQEQLAQMLGVTDKSISKWETGSCLPDPSKYECLCGILGISIDELFSGKRTDAGNEKEAQDYLIDLLLGRMYPADCGITYVEFRNAFMRIAETTVMLRKFASKEEAVAYMVKETGLPHEECARAYDVFRIEPQNNGG